jgi:hypothetical protein
MQRLKKQNFPTSHLRFDNFLIFIYLLFFMCTLYLPIYIFRGLTAHLRFDNFFLFVDYIFTSSAILHIFVMCTLYFHLPRPAVHLRSYIYIFPPQIFVSVSDTTLFWSFGTPRILFQNSLNIAVVNLVLWITIYIVIFAIYCKKKQKIFHVATDGFMQPLESITTITNIGDGNAPEHPAMGPPTTQQMHVSGGSDEEELGVVLLPALDGNGGMVDLEKNNVVSRDDDGDWSSLLR